MSYHQQQCVGVSISMWLCIDNVIISLLQMLLDVLLASQWYRSTRILAIISLRHQVPRVQVSWQFCPILGYSTTVHSKVVNLLGVGPNNGEVPSSYHITDTEKSKHKCNDRNFIILLHITALCVENTLRLVPLHRRLTMAKMRKEVVGEFCKSQNIC